MFAYKLVSLLGLVYVWCTGEAVTVSSDSHVYVCHIPHDLKLEILSYQSIVNRIIDTTTRGPHRGNTWKELADFVDKFGSRISGSKNLENAIDYMLNRSSYYYLDNVHGEPVQVPHWVRGTEEATLLSPRVTKLSMIGLGGSVSTPPGGITAPVLVVRTFEELKQKAKQAKGKIIVFAETFESYGETVKYRTSGAVEGAKVGAVATLIRSVTPFSINSPHTGWQEYSDSLPKIPTAAIAVEDALMLLRMYERGDNVTISLKMISENLPLVKSRNTIAELSGRSAGANDNVVIVSGHLDSWDVGSGAMDDGGGAFISWFSLVLLRQLGLQPRRTIRSILWTGEEEGLYGAFAYDKAHDSHSFNLLMESDEGTFKPEGLFFSGSGDAQCIMHEILSLLYPINTTTLSVTGDVGSDISVWKNRGVPMAALKNANDRYFWYHHSSGDRMSVVGSDDLDRCVALWASVAYVVSDLSVPLPRYLSAADTFYV